MQLKDITSLRISPRPNPSNWQRAEAALFLATRQFRNVDFVREKSYVQTFGFFVENIFSRAFQDYDILLQMLFQFFCRIVAVFYHCF
ncbi:hypothetical protein [Planobacterium oryzisoli]|uniref:Uncharacterized protein n=1 Tax=Planobacterium oryzisoli TaxID=2771435 RepID=A0A930YWE3_9FLAO|nr:hypothetical protein [Planobacterium oryzisoli]MBF5027580.1 hypothetical protein [Planobacterium oryzisoli]